MTVYVTLQEKSTRVAAVALFCPCPSIYKSQFPRLHLFVHLITHSDLRLARTMLIFVLLSCLVMATFSVPMIHISRHVSRANRAQRARMQEMYDLARRRHANTCVLARMGNPAIKLGDCPFVHDDYGARAHAKASFLDRYYKDRCDIVEEKVAPGPNVFVLLFFLILIITIMAAR